METNKTIDVSFQIVDNVVGGMPDQTVKLTLEFNSPSKFLDLVEIGGSGTHREMTVVVVDDDGKTTLLLRCALFGSLLLHITVYMVDY